MWKYIVTYISIVRWNMHPVYNFELYILGMIACWNGFCIFPNTSPFIFTYRDIKFSLPSRSIIQNFSFSIGDRLLLWHNESSLKILFLICKFFLKVLLRQLKPLYQLLKRHQTCFIKQIHMLTDTLVHPKIKPCIISLWWDVRIAHNWSESRGSIHFSKKK